jgi:rod shape-determining protein MreD
MLALLQNSFFAHFNLWGAMPSLVLIFFALLVFFEKNNINFSIFFYALAAGLLLDLYSSSQLGISMILLILFGFFAKKFQQLMLESRGKYAFVQFLAIFFILFFSYNISLQIYFFIFKEGFLFLSLNSRFAGALIYNLVFSSLFFWAYTRFFSGLSDNRQLSLFKK